MISQWKIKSWYRWKASPHDNFTHDGMLSNFVRFRMEGLLFFRRRHVSIRSADKTIYFGDTSPREKDISTRSTVRHRSQCMMLHPIPFFRYRLLAIHFSLVPNGPQKRETGARNRTFYVLFSLFLAH